MVTQKKKGKKLTLDRGPSGLIDRDENLNFIKFDCQVKMHKSFNKEKLMYDKTATLSLVLKS